MADVQVTINIHVNPAVQPLSVDVSGVPTDATVGVPYSGQIVASGGVPPYSFTPVSGALPDGLSGAADGSISGTPTTAGDFSAVIDVADSAGATVQANLKAAVKK